MTRKPPEWRVGERITAEHLNAMRRESLRSRSASMHGPDLSVVGDNFGSQSAAMQKPHIQLVVAREDFANYQQIGRAHV